MRETELQITTVAIDELIPYEHNAKRHPKKQVREIANSMEAFGNCDPIAAWHRPDGGIEIVEGHGRVLALKELGVQTAPVIFLDHLTDDERRAYAHVHNQTTLSSGFDERILADDIALLDFAWDSFGFNWKPETDAAAAASDEFDEEAEQRCQLGELWQLGRHRLMCGDSSNPEHIHILVAGGGVPMMVFTDPPYGVAIGSRNKLINDAAPGRGGHIEQDIIGDTLDKNSLYDMLVQCFKNLREVCDESCTYYVSSPQGGELGLMMMMMMRDAGLPVRHNLIWAKNCATFSLGRLDYDYKHEPIFYTWTRRHRFYGENETTLLEFDKPSASKLHPTMKPVSLVSHLMENSSKPGDVVMDIFGGSGTTLVAAEALGRTCYMMELDPHYCDVIIKRWEVMTGEKAVRIDPQL